MLSEKLLYLAFTRAVKHGTLEMITAGGRDFTFGDGANHGSRSASRMPRPRWPCASIRN